MRDKTPLPDSYEKVDSVQWCEIGGERLYFRTWRQLLQYVKEHKVDAYAFVSGPFSKPINGKFYEEQCNKSHQA